MKKVAIMVVAQGIPDHIKNRFSACVDLSAPSTPYDIHFLSESPKPGSNYVFSKSRIMNAGLKKLCAMDYSLVVQADVDIVVPPLLLDKTLELGSQPMTMFHNHHRRVWDHTLQWKFPQDYEQADWGYLFDTLAPENANGCWNGATPETWMASGGYNELQIQWGTEDDTFRHTAGHRGVRFLNYNKFCLLHLNHPPRQADRRKHNKAMAALIQSQGGKDWLA